MAVDSTSANELIVEKVSSMLVEPLTAASVVLASNPTVFQSSEPLRVPTLTGNTNPGWVGENELIPEADELTFGEIELMPTSRKSIKTITRVSNELVRMAKSGVSDVLQRRLVSDVRDKLDTALLTGDGADNSVMGIINHDDVTRAAWIVADPDSILDGLATLAASEVSPTRILMNGTDFFAIRKLKDSDGRGLLQSDLTAEATYRIHGVPVTVTNKLPVGTLVAANWADIAVVRDQDTTVRLDSSRYLEYDQTAIRVTARYDLGILRPAGVLVMETGYTPEETD